MTLLRYLFGQRWFLIALCLAIYIPLMMFIGWAIRPVTDSAWAGLSGLLGIGPALALLIGFGIWCLWSDRRDRQRANKP